MSECNFRCPYCYNTALVKGEPGLDFPEEKIFSFLEKRKRMLDGVVISGGEPTLNDGLVELVSRIKDMGYRVKLDTNGSSPDKVAELIKNRLLDYVALDIKTSPEKYHLLSFTEDTFSAVERVFAVLHDSKAQYELRTTCVPGIVEEKDLYKIARIFRGVPKYVLQQFRPRETLDPGYSIKKPYTKKELFRFKSILERTVREVCLRGV